MSINNRDDYDKLAKILYPSIEASGNVYFGQTRKLTMDEILGKNNLNFESHIESIQVEDNEKDYGYDYKSYFVWKLGPLYGSIRFNPTEDGNYTFANFPDHIKFAIINEYEDETNFYYQYHISTGPDEIPGYWYDEDEMAHFHFDRYDIYGTVFAKYEIHFDDTSYNETISSGEYKSYAKSAYVEFKDLCITNRSNPTNALDRNIGDRHFYVDIKDGHYYLYIQICTNTASTNYYFDADSSTFEVKWDESFRDPLTLTAIEDSVTVKLISHGNAVAWYKYKLEGQDWENYTFEDPIQLNVGEYVKFKGDLQGVRDRDTDYVSFSVLGDGRVKASGDIRSMSAEHDQPFTSLYTTYSKLFYNVQKLVTAPKLPSSRLTDYNFYYTFYGCTNLQEAPKIFASRFYGHCCERMFYGCSQLNKVYPISAVSLGIATNSKFIYMFNSYYVNELEFYFYDENRKDANISADFTSWIPETSHGTFTTNINPGNFGTFPEDWTKVQIPFVPNNTVISSASANDIIEQDTILYKQDKLFTSGANSGDNGRGDLTSKDTLFSMLETNPLYNGGVAFDTYNKDGSFNQEIWGLKSFNSPVMFRNGLYGECASLTTLNEEPQFNFSIENVATGDKDSLQSYGIGSTLSCRNINSYTDDTDEYMPYAYSELSVIHSELDDKHALYDGGITHFTAQYKCGASINETMYAGIQSYAHHYRNVFLPYPGASVDSIYYNHMVNKICAGNVLITLNDLCNITYGESHEDSYIEVNSQVIPNQSDTVNLGSDTKKYFNTYSTYVHATTINATTINATTTNTNKIVGTSNNVLTIGEPNNKVYNIECSNIYCGKLNGTYASGTALALLPDIYGSMRVGTIALVILDSPLGRFTQSLPAGSRIRRGDSVVEDGVRIFGIDDLRIYFAEIDNLGNITQGDTASISENDRFALLSQVGSYTSGGTALIMRIK